MKGRSRLERYQNLRSNTSTETNVDEKTTTQTGHTSFISRNNPDYRSSYTSQSNRSRLYQTSEYDSLLKEHEDFLKSLDEQFGTLEQSTFFAGDNFERQTSSVQQVQPTPYEYTQPAQQPYQPAFQQPLAQSEQYIQPTLSQQPTMTQQRVAAESFQQQSYPQTSFSPGYTQQVYSQPLQQQYTQPIQRIVPEQTQQYIQQPYVQESGQPVKVEQTERVVRKTIESIEQLQQPENVYESPILEVKIPKVEQFKQPLEEPVGLKTKETLVVTPEEQMEKDEKTKQDNVLFVDISTEKHDAKEEKIGEDKNDVDLYKLAYQGMLKLYPDLNTKKEEVKAEEKVTFEDEIIDEELESLELVDEEETIELLTVIDDIKESSEVDALETEISKEEQIIELEIPELIKKEDPIEFFAVVDEIEEISDAEFLEVEPFETTDEIMKDGATFEFVKPEFEADTEIEIIDEIETVDYDQIEQLSKEDLDVLVKEIEQTIDDVKIVDHTQEIFIVDDTEDYFTEVNSEKIPVDEMEFSQEDVIKDLDLLEEDFDAEELDGKVIEIIDEKDSEKVMDNYLQESKVDSEEDEIFDFEKVDEPFESEDIVILDSVKEESDVIDEHVEQYTESDLFKFIDDILVDVKNDAEMIQTQQVKQEFFNVEEDKTVEDISRVLSGWDLDDLQFVEEESIIPDSDLENMELLEEAVYQQTNPVHTPVYYDDPVNVDQLTQKLENERVLRQQMLEQTKQIKLQVREYEDELDSVNSSMSKTNKILNFVLTLLILTLFVILFVIGFWFAQERGLI